MRAFVTISSIQEKDLAPPVIGAFGFIIDGRTAPIAISVETPLQPNDTNRVIRERLVEMLIAANVGLTKNDVEFLN